MYCHQSFKTFHRVRRYSNKPNLPLVSVLSHRLQYHSSIQSHTFYIFIVKTISSAEVATSRVSQCFVLTAVITAITIKYDSILYYTLRLSLLYRHCYDLLISSCRKQSKYYVPVRIRFFLVSINIKRT